jgi:hypothetical protein
MNAPPFTCIVCLVMKRADGENALPVTTATAAIGLAIPHGVQ